MKSVKLSNNSQSHDCQFEVNQLVHSNNAASVQDAWEGVFSQFQVEKSLDDQQLSVYNHFTNLVRNWQKKEGESKDTAMVEAVNSGIEMIKNKAKNISKLKEGEKDNILTLSCLKSMLKMISENIQNYFTANREQFEQNKLKRECLFSSVRSLESTIEAQIGTRNDLQFDVEKNWVNSDHSLSVYHQQSTDYQTEPTTPCSIEKESKDEEMELLNDELPASQISTISIISSIRESQKLTIKTICWVQQTNDAKREDKNQLLGEAKDEKEISINLKPGLVQEAKMNEDLAISSKNITSEEGDSSSEISSILKSNTISIKAGWSSRSTSTKSDSDNEVDSEGNRSPVSILKKKKRAKKFKAAYRTRLAVKLYKRVTGRRVKIIEKENEVKEFYKRRKITTDFEFNPRFDDPKSCRRKRDQKENQKILENFVIKKTDGILKPAPSKEIFW
jgi:hypothetical protein